MMKTYSMSQAHPSTFASTEKVSKTSQVSNKSIQVSSMMPSQSLTTLPMERKPTDQTTFTRWLRHRTWQVSLISLMRLRRTSMLVKWRNHWGRAIRETITGQIKRLIISMIIHLGCRRLGLRVRRRCCILWLERKKRGRILLRCILRLMETLLQVNKGTENTIGQLTQQLTDLGMVSNVYWMELLCLFIMKDLSLASQRLSLLKRLLKTRKLSLKTNLERPRIWAKENLLFQKNLHMALRIWQEVNIGMQQNVFMENQMRSNFNQTVIWEDQQNLDAEMLWERLKIKQECLEHLQLEQIFHTEIKDQLLIIM